MDSLVAAEWATYLEWNSAIAIAVYDDDQEGVPAYLDLEDATLDIIRDLADAECMDPAGGLQAAVLATLKFGQGPAAVLAEHITRLSEWERGNQLGEPPCLALLAILSLAAENMHEGDGKAANNFYGRLADLLALNNEEKEEFVKAYRRKGATGRPISEVLWSSLTTWLERNEGNRGLPTAYAVGHAHIGPPLSQALVRKTDRERLFSAFTAYGLSPRSIIDPAEMRILIEEWLSRTPCPASNSFARLWRDHESARERIIDVALLELAAWDGAERGEHNEGITRPSRLRLVAALRSFITTELQITLGLPAADQPGDQFDLLGADKATLGRVDFVARTGGWLVCSETSRIDAASILLGDVVLRRLDDESTATRQPRRLIPLRFDVALQAFVEQDRVSLGDEHMLLAHPQLVTQLDPVIERAARPGYKRHDGLKGLPAGWVLYERVQILSGVPTEALKHADLRPLQPMTRRQVVLHGGLKLPGNIEKWSSHHPPELLVTSEESDMLRAELRTVRALATPAAADRSQSSHQPVLIWSLASENLQDGDYEITVYDGDGPISNPVMLRLRSADNPALRTTSDAVAILHRKSNELFGLSATTSTDHIGFSVAPEGSPALERELTSFAQTPVWWTSRHRGDSGAGSVVLFAPQADSESCVVTGAHYFRIETAERGMKSVEGKCDKCGMVKRYRTSGRSAKRSAKRNDQPPPQIVVRQLAPIPEAVQMTWTTGFDAICHIGEGPASSLLTVAAQIDTGEIVGDAFIRRLELLGHIEVERNGSDLTARRWRINDPTLVGLTDGRFCLTGFRSDGLIAALEDFGYEHGFEVSIDDRAASPAQITIPHLRHELLSELTTCISNVTRLSASVIPDAARSIAAAVPPLSDLIDRLPVTPVISGRATEKWDPTSATFHTDSDANAPGAFRISAYGRTYLYRRESHLGTMQAILGNNRLVKYAAALDTNTTLLGYDAEQKVLFVPLGADLPGLYGRSAVLASGMPPVENLEQRALEYRSVPADLAKSLNERLMT